MSIRRSNEPEGSYTSSLRANRSAEADILRRLSDPEYKEGFGAELAKVDLAVALALARHATGLTQTALADMIGAKQSYVAKLEGGEANPTIGTVGRILAKMDRRLSVSTRPLVGEADAVYWNASSQLSNFTASGYVSHSVAQGFFDLDPALSGLRERLVLPRQGWGALQTDINLEAASSSIYEGSIMPRTRIPVEVA